MAMAIPKQQLYQDLTKILNDMYDPPLTELKCSYGEFLDTKFYCVEPVGGRWTEMESWVRNTFGEPGDMWPKEHFMWPETPRWLQNNSKFWFRDEADRTLFLMKYSA